MRLRSGMENKLSKMKRYHGLRRARFRGFNKFRLHIYFTAVAVNIKRWTYNAGPAGRFKSEALL
ncbi:MAG: transposase [Candidatus Nitronauta litoralis]|uniref:Transposase n=1 Tax=Candidatus Nitronauta litoralis TaxID=2705533 RepID=A0A7T0BWR2_9BACT|nr:MAG: transposase [Candidatus Nitronauta litoralis]